MQRFNFDPEHISCRLFLEFDKIRECAEFYQSPGTMGRVRIVPYNDHKIEVRR